MCIGGAPARLGTRSRPPNPGRGYAHVVPVLLLLLLVVLVFLTVYRVTRLIVADTFPPMAAMRDAIEDRWGTDSWQNYLANCPWCVSGYVAAGVVAATAWTVGLPYPLLMIPAASALTGIIDTYVDPA